MRRKNPRRVAPMFQMKRGETMEDTLLRGARLEKPKIFTQADHQVLGKLRERVDDKKDAPFVTLIKELEENHALKPGVAREFLAVYRTDPALAERVVEGDVALRSAYERVRAMSLLKRTDTQGSLHYLEAWAMILFSDTLALVELARLWRGDPEHDVPESEAFEWIENNGGARYANPCPQLILHAAWDYIISPAYEWKRIRTKYPSELETLVWTKAKAVVRLLRQYDEKSSKGVFSEPGTTPILEPGEPGRVGNRRDVFITKLEKRVEELESLFVKLARDVRESLVEIPVKPADALTEGEVAFLRGFARSR